MPLSSQQRKFCEEYVNNGLNGTKAYLSAYKSCKKETTAMSNASRLLRNAKILEYVEELQEKLKEKAIMSAEERMVWLSKVVQGEIKETGFFDGEKVKREPSLSDKLKGIDILNKMTGQYVTKIKGDVTLSYEEAIKEVSDDDEY